jgi:holo-ACP synthase CitX
MTYECTLEDILNSRDKRDLKRHILLDRYRGELITFHLNIPGKVKDKLLYKITMIEGHKQLMAYLNNHQIRLIYESLEFQKTGPEGVLIVKSDSEKLKRLLVEFESSHPLGRIFDLDVFSKNGKPLSREELGLPQRRCYVCDDLAKACARSKRHDIKDIIKSIDQMMTTFHTTESHRES